MADVTFQMIVFNGDHVLEAVLETILPYGKVVVTEGPVAYWQRQGFVTSTDRTNEILADLVGEENVVHGQWDEKDQMVNASLHLVPDKTTHIWGVDADECYKRKDLELILGWLDGWDSVSFKMYSFFGGFDRYMTGFEENFEVHRIKRWYPGARWATHRPPTILSPDGTPWRNARHLPHTLLAKEHDIRFYHYSYVFPYAMQDKARYYDSYDPRGNIPEYFWKVYMPWVGGTEYDRGRIEMQYKGVHNWLPTRRGQCCTKLFTGQHPLEIRKRMAGYKIRFNQEYRSLMVAPPVMWGAT
ncbi:MAG TPA: hypothetical protein VMW58_01810 [Anaerolineae bacterium]|nr:hypothetical protein [Anaerolineae bacterium]